MTSHFKEKNSQDPDSVSFKCFIRNVIEDIYEVTFALSRSRCEGSKIIMRAHEFSADFPIALKLDTFCSTYITSVVKN